MIKECRNDLRSRFRRYDDPPVAVELERETIFRVMRAYSVHELNVSIISLLMCRAHSSELNLIRSYMLDERSKVSKKACKLLLLLQCKKVFCMSCLVTQSGFKVLFVQDEDVLTENQEIDGAFDVKTWFIV